MTFSSTDRYGCRKNDWNTNPPVRDCAIDEIGTILISGPTATSGYTDTSKNGSLILVDEAGTAWINTGDLARQDADGFFWMTGRSKELIIRGGHNIDPAVIEQPLYSHPALQLAAAVRRPDAHAGELPVAYVQLRPEHRATEEELLAYLSECIAERAAMPKSIIVIDQMRLTPVGKIFKPELKHREIEYAVRQALIVAGVGVRAVSVGADPATQNVCATVTLANAGTEPAAKAALDRFSFSYRLIGSA